MSAVTPRVVVYSTLFPHAGQPGTGLFIRERMFRVGQSLPLIVVSPVPWFPFENLIRKWRPGFRAVGLRHEVQSGFEVYRPRFLSFPGLFKWVDGFFMALGSVPTMIRLRRQFRFSLIDAHFAYPDGYAATLLGKWFDTPVTITLRGTEKRLVNVAGIRGRLRTALERATRIFTVSSSLKNLAVGQGIDSEKIRVISNGVDAVRFHPCDRAEVRQRLELSADVPVLVSVGALVERKGFHRVIELLPRLQKKFPGLVYLVIGGSSPEGDWTERLHDLTRSLGVQGAVRFLGEISPESLKYPLSAADVFVLSTRNEGWANVILEAMACGLPVVTTDVGGNREIVCAPYLGTIIPFDDQEKLAEVLEDALSQQWDRTAIRNYAESNTWDRIVENIVEEFNWICGTRGTVGNSEPIHATRP